MKCRNIFCGEHEPDFRSGCIHPFQVETCEKRKMYNRMTRTEKYAQWVVEHDKYYGRGKC